NNNVPPSLSESLVTPAVPTAAAQPSPTPEITTYVVQAGDTLGTISQLFEVSMEDIMAANGISNPNLIALGTELIIPLGGFPTPTPPPQPTATIATAPTPIPTLAPTIGEVDIQITNVLNPNLLTVEAVVITNFGARPVALQNWELRNPDGQIYTFGQITLFGDGAFLTVHSGNGTNGISDLYWRSENPVWAPGDTVTLVDAEGTTQATYTIPQVNGE
ncbi:MAG TPA: lamin tail domain-containing protein, partial [Anaerolineae bacterium]|nr:lamin tail domain-containing protein [Anaerolineae bacterium]